MIENWWAIVRTPDGVHCYELGAYLLEDLSGRLAEICRELGVPEDRDSMDPAWDVQAAPGEPHARLLAVAIGVHRLAGADRVEPGGLEGPRLPPAATTFTAGPDGPRRLLPHEVHTEELSAAALDATTSRKATA